MRMTSPPTARHPGISAGELEYILAHTPHLRADAGGGGGGGGRGGRAAAAAERAPGVPLALEVKVILTPPVFFISDSPYKICRAASE